MSRQLSEAISRVQAGEIVIYPTETFYGLGADPYCGAAVEQICVFKQRKPEAGIPLIAASSAFVESIIAEEDEERREQRISLQTKFWPGPLTLVISIKDAVRKKLSPLVLGPDGSLALRVSAESIARELAAGAGGFITTTSANAHNEPPASTVAKASAYFPDLFALAGKDPLQASAPSTIIDIRQSPFRVLREGAISSETLERWM